MSEKFIIEPKAAPRVTTFVRLAPATIARLNELEKHTGVKRAEIIQQALNFALERLEL